MKLSVIIPVFNEKDTIEEIIKKVEEVDLEKEIIVVDDGSTDGTKEILGKINRKNLKVLYHEENRGKGEAIRTALPHTTGDIIVIQDADLEYNPREFPHLLQPILKGKARVVYGSRVLGKRPHPPFLMWWFFYWGGRSLSLITNLLYHSNITDEPTCYKAFKREVLLNIPLECRGFEFCPEVTAKVLKRGIKIVEVPISHKPRSIQEGKKIRLKDWFIAVYTLIKYKFKD